MAVSIGPVIGIKGEREFRASLKEIIAETQSYRAEIDKLSATFSKNDDALTRNQKVQEKLNSQISVQEKVVQDNIAIHEKAAQKYSEQTMLVEAYKNAVASEQQMLDSMGKKLEALRAQYGDNDAIVKGATETYAQLRKQLADDSKEYENLKVDVHRSGQTMQEWKVKVAQSEVELENLRKELAKAPNFVEEFNRKTVEHTRNLQKYENQVSQLDSEMKKTESSYDRFTSAIKRASDATENIRQKISAEAGVLVENRRLKNEAIQTEEKQRKAYEELLKKLADAERQYGRDSEQVRILNDAVDEQARLVHEASMKTAEYTQKVTETETAINNLNNELSENSALKAWGETFDGVGEKMEQFGDIMTKYVTTPLLALGTYSVKVASDFEDGMAKIYTIAIDGAEPMEKMRQELVELSNQTGFSLDDLTEATYQAVSASVDSTKAVDFMTDATKLARAGFTTTTKAVDLLTTVINAYGMKAEDAAKISDILLKTQNDGKTVIDELASSMGIIIPMASNYGVGLDQIAAAYATMTKQGVKTEKATTFLRAVFTELEKESSDVAKILDKKTGKPFAQLMKEGNSLSDVLRILYAEAGNNTEEFQRLFGNVRATQAVASLVNNDFGLFDYELGRVRDSAGQVNKALEVMETPSLKARRAVNKLKNTAVDLGDSMLEMVMPSFEKATDKVTELTDAFVKLQPESKEIIIKNAALAASIGPVIKVGGKLIKYIGAVLTGTGSFIPLIALATGGLIAMATAVQVAAKEQDLLREKQYGLSEEAKTAIARVDELRQAHQDFKVSMQGETTEVMNNVAYVQELVRQYDNLCTETGEVKEGNEQLAEVLKGEIAEALGISYDDLQLLIDQNGKLSSAIGGTVEAYKKQALAAVYQQQLTEATQRLVEHQMLDKQLTEQQSQALEKFNTTMREAVDAKRAIKEAEEKSLPVTDEMYKRYNEATLNYSEAKNALDTVSQAIRDNKAEMKNAQSEIDFYGNKIAETGDKAEESAEKVEQSGEKIVQSAEETAEGVKEAMNIDADDTAYNFMLGFANGITKYRHLATEAASIAGKRALDALNGSVEVSSPSKLTYQTGRYFVEGFANALDEGMPMMNRIAQRLGTSASSGLAFGSYLPETGGVVNNTKSISAPISINMTVNGNVDDPDGLTSMIADKLVSMINGERSVFA